MAAVEECLAQLLFEPADAPARGRAAVEALFGALAAITTTDVWVCAWPTQVAVHLTAMLWHQERDDAARADAALWDAYRACFVADSNPDAAAHDVLCNVLARANVIVGALIAPARRLLEAHTPPAMGRPVA